MNSINKDFLIKIVHQLVVLFLSLYSMTVFCQKSISSDNLNKKVHDTTIISSYINKATHHEKNRKKAIERLENTLFVIKKSMTKKHSEVVQQKLLQQLAKTNSEIGRMFIELSQVKLAVPYLFEALKYYKILKDKHGIAKTTMNIGLAFNDQKNYKKSKVYYGEATKICVEINDLKTLGKIYNNFSVSLYDQNKKEESIEYVHKALEVFKKINDQQGISYSLYNLAQKFNDTGNPQKAMPYLIESLKIRREIGDIRGIAESLNAIGICHRWMNNIPSALKYLNEANQLAQKNGFFHVLESSSDMLNYIYEEDLKDPENALKSYRLFIAARDTIRNEKVKVALLEKHYETEYEKKEALLKEQTAAEKQEQKIIFVSIISFLFAVLFFSLLWFSFYKKKKVLEKEIEQKEISLEIAEKERRRISADLHDELGSGISTIALLSNRINQQKSIVAIKEDATSIMANTKKISEKLIEIIWELNVEHNNLEDILLFIQKQGTTFFNNNNIKFSMLIPLEISVIPFSSHDRKQIYLSVKECFQNINKHAYASQVLCDVIIDTRLTIRIIDNGKGFDLHKIKKNNQGEGLKNLDYRLKNLNGTSTIISNNEGTTIILQVPLEKV